MKQSPTAAGCCTTPSAMGFWAAMFAVFFGAGLLLRTLWPAARPFGDTVILAALAAACFVNFRRNRTLHCGLTAPLFIAGALAALLSEAGAWRVDQAVIWGVVVAGVVIAFAIERRTVGRRQRTINP